jgi:hypothetical protein
MALIDVNWKPGGRELRQFALLFLVFAVGFGTYVHFFKDWSPLVAQLLWGAGVLVGLGGLLFPPLARPVYIAMMALALPIGMVVSTVLMTLIYYLVLTPIGLVMRLVGYDPLRRGLDPAASSYWIKRTPPENVQRYFRQY